MILIAFLILRQPQAFLGGNHISKNVLYKYNKKYNFLNK